MIYMAAWGAGPWDETLELSESCSFCLCRLTKPQTCQRSDMDNILSWWNPSSLDDMVRFMVRSTLYGKQTKSQVPSRIAGEVRDWLPLLGQPWSRRPCLLASKLSIRKVPATSDSRLGIISAGTHLALLYHPSLYGVHNGPLAECPGALNSIWPLGLELYSLMGLSLLRSINGCICRYVTHCLGYVCIQPNR